MALSFKSCIIYFCTYMRMLLIFTVIMQLLFFFVLPFFALISCLHHCVCLRVFFCGYRFMVNKSYSSYRSVIFCVFIGWRNRWVVMHFRLFAFCMNRLAERGAGGWRRLSSMAVVAEEKRVAMTTEVGVMSSDDNVVSSSSDDLLMQSAADADTRSHGDHHDQTPGRASS